MFDKLCSTKAKSSIFQPMTLEEALFMQTENMGQEQTMPNNLYGYNRDYESAPRQSSNNNFTNLNQQSFYTYATTQDYVNTINQKIDIHDTTVYVNDFLIKADREIMCINQYDPRNQLFTYKCQHIFDGECFMNALTGHEVLYTSLKNRVVFDKHGVQRDELNINDVYVRAGKKQ